jgi:hypothetical protein
MKNLQSKTTHTYTRRSKQAGAYLAGSNMLRRRMHGDSALGAGGEAPRVGDGAAESVRGKKKKNRRK